LQNREGGEEPLIAQVRAGRAEGDCHVERLRSGRVDGLSTAGELQERSSVAVPSDRPGASISLEPGAVEQVGIGRSVVVKQEAERDHTLSRVSRDCNRITP